MRILDCKMPLKEGEEHCPYCGGYGGHPIDKQDRYMTRFEPEKCYHCNGSGKQKKD